MKLLFITLLLIVFGDYTKPKPDEERVNYAWEVLEKAIQEKDSVNMAEGYYLLGKRHADILDIEEAYRFFYQALSLNQKLNNHYQIGKVYLRLAHLELKQNHLERAISYTKDAVEVFEKNDIQHGLYSAYTLLGEIYLTGDNDRSEARLQSSPISLDSVLHYSLKAEAIAVAEGDMEDIAKTRFIIGRLLLSQRNPKALDHLSYAAKALENSSSSTTLLNCMAALAHAWIVFDAPEKSSKVLARAQEIIDSVGTIGLTTKANHHTVYSMYYKKIGDWQKALEHHEFAMNFYKLIAKSERNENLSKWRIRLDIEKKEIELKIRNQELKAREETIAQQKLLIIISIISLFLFGLLSYFLYKNYTKQHFLSRKNAFLIQEQNHRVKNNLQIISSILNLQKEHLSDIASQNALAESQARIDSVVLLHRQLYENSDFELIDMEKLFDDIINSVALTFGKGNVKSEIELETKFLEPDTATSVGVIVNELVMNSFKHAFQNQDPTITITSVERKDKIEVTYRDFGQDNLEELFRKPENKGFGLQLIDLIVRQINGRLTYHFDNGSVFTLIFNKPST